MGAEFECGELPAAPAVFADGAAGYQAPRAEVEINLGPQRESCEEGEVPQKINFRLYWNSRPRVSRFCTKERPNCGVPMAPAAMFGSPHQKVLVRL